MLILNSSAINKEHQVEQHQVWHDSMHNEGRKEFSDISLAINNADEYLDGKRWN